MNERDALFARIREALAARTVAPPPAGLEAGRPHGEGSRPPEPPPVERDFTRLLPRVGPAFEDWISAFAAACRELRTDLVVCPDEAAVRETLCRLRDAEGWQRVAAHAGPLVQPAAEVLGLPVLWTDAGYDPQALERCDVGLTECDALVAQTGSVVVTSARAGGRALSVLPPHHVVLARREQLVPDLPAALARLTEQYPSAWPSMISFLTGPSRTGDIERILVLGAHGPKKLTVLLG